MAAVVLPAASSASVRSRTSSPMPAISAMPPALSEMGPYASIARPVASVLSMPSAAHAMPNMPATERKAKDDVGRGTRAAGISHVLDRLRVRGAVDRERELLGQEERGAHPRGGRHEHGRNDELHLECVLNLRHNLGRLQVCCNKRRGNAHQDADGRDHEGEREGGEILSVTHRRDRRHNQRSASGLGERAEQVRAHACNVTNVVTDVVSNHSGVARIVLGDVLLDLADQVSSDVSSLGVDAAANTAEQGN
eukprot:362807-Chlamydomonas_euryale.AAC.9